MIDVISGHLGSGAWRFKCVDNVTVMANVQPLNDDDEFRIGPDQVIRYEIEQELENNLIVIIYLSDDRYCRAKISNKDLSNLETMVVSSESAPAYKKKHDMWINGLLAFFAACMVYEFLK